MKNLFLVLFTIFFFAITTAFAQSENSNSIDMNKLYSEDEVDTQAIIKKLEVHPKLLKECANGGSVKIKIILHKSGRVTDVEFLEKNNCAGINEEKIIVAVQKTKFSPALKNGFPVTQFTVKTLRFRTF